LHYPSLNSGVPAQRLRRKGGRAKHGRRAPSWAKGVVSYSLGGGERDCDTTREGSKAGRKAAKEMKDKGNSMGRRVSKIKRSGSLGGWG